MLQGPAASTASFSAYAPAPGPTAHPVSPDSTGRGFRTHNSPSLSMQPARGTFLSWGKVWVQDRNSSLSCCQWLSVLKLASLHMYQPAVCPFTTTGIIVV